MGSWCKLKIPKLQTLKCVQSTHCTMYKNIVLGLGVRDIYGKFLLEI